MYCYQCEQTAQGVACVTVGLCGKTAEVAALQDLLIEAAKGLSQYAHRLRQMGIGLPEIDAFVLEALFTTVTNVSFDPARLEDQLREAACLRDQLQARYRDACAARQTPPDTLSGPALWQPASTRAGLVGAGEAASIAHRLTAQGADLTGLQDLLLYGVKGMAAYACHARILGQTDESVAAFVHEVLTVLAEVPPDAEALLELVLRCGTVSLAVLDLLDRANTGAYGDPQPTPVLMGHRAGKAILVSGHDLKDLAALLEQTVGLGVDIYTHGEMLPAHGYPELKKYPHLVGHYGGAWQRQRSEFAAFPGSILMTTNCIQNPTAAYRDRLFTCGLVAHPEATALSGRTFAPLIASALAAPGFAEDGPVRHHLAGFGHKAVLGVAPQIIDAVKAGAIRRFVLIGGCDGHESARSYFDDLAGSLPQDAVVLTLGCGKFRVIDHDMGTIAGLPRLLDMGQCNDAYSAIKVAQALAEAFGVGVNDLPLSLVLSWFEQKAVTVLLALLALGVRNIRLGPNLPAFITPPVLKVLVDRFGVMPVGTVADDLAAMGLAA
ncbi:hydroxylamine reductase [Rhodospirillum rubrum]|uniref:hydroxylamine reductase n=1 Tax=Rhodospirillum rubrum TaxID=1085 RepID=UPI001906F7B1|nr:hydroxylamine reductase [Rhodospirillum rubrum]MBK1664930.1 hydroxylamine reductase [Rhodospirillum rubrum]MBK1676099.1 hydroxylamine reductase [Rhodospirillum rubrum]